MTNLVPAEIPDGAVASPDEGEEICASTVGAGKGPVRPAYQSLFNKVWSIFRGRVTVRALIASDAPGAWGKVPAVPPPDGAVVASLGQFVQGLFGDLIGACRLDGARVVFSSLIAGPLGGNPPGNIALTNELRPLLVPKAWGRFRTDGAGNVVILDRANVADIRCEAGTSWIRVVLASPMADANYSVVAGAMSATSPQIPSLGSTASPNPPTASTFFLLFPGAFRPDTTVVEASFQVFGRQTS